MEFKEKKFVPALFVHIQKTAGTSIVDLARMHYGNANVVSHGDHLDGFSEFPLKDKFFAPEKVLSQFAGVPFVSGHFGFDFAKVLMNGRYTFTFLRDPVERILSFYYFCRTRDPNEFRIYKLTQEVALDRFLAMGLDVPEVRACIWNTQAWQLAHGYGNSDGRNIMRFTPEEILDLAIRHLDDFSYVGFAENFENDRDRILKGLGIALPKGKVVSNANPGRPTAQDLPSSTRRLLERLTELDRILYNTAKSQQETRLRHERTMRGKSSFRDYVGKWLNR
jgi:hypothetical protein